MSLVATIQAGAAAAFAAAGDLLETATFHLAGVAAYNPATDAITPEAPNDPKVKLLIDTFNSLELGGAFRAVMQKGEAVQKGDIRAFALIADLPKAPTVDDTLTFRGDRWSIVRIGEQAQTLYELQIRRVL